MIAIVAAALAGCVEPEGPTGPPVERAYAVLATIDLPGGGTLEFGQRPSGGIVTTEDSPVDAPSMMGYYGRRYDATPLELFTALAPDAEPPPELVAAHAAQVAREARGSAEPRRLPPPPDKATADTTYTWYYAADCSLAEDGGWFDAFWQTYDWSWHWYHRTTLYADASPYVAGHYVQAHLCNDGGVTVKTMFVSVSDGDASCATGNWEYALVADVAPQHRRQFRVTADPHRCIYDVAGQNRIGANALPAWDLGLTAP